MELDVADLPPVARGPDLYEPEESLPKIGRKVADTTQLISHLARMEGGRSSEFLHAYFLDDADCLAWSEMLAIGKIASVDFMYRPLIATALRVNAMGLILAHNHPSGIAKPSARDITTTMDLQRLCKKIGIDLIDHVIVAGGQCFSFRAEKLL